MSRIAYTNEHLEWLSLHKDDFNSYQELADCFNNVFGMNKTSEAMRQVFNKRLKLQPDIKRNAPIMQEEINWLNEHAGQYDTKEIIKELNKIFGNNRTRYTLRDLIEQKKIKKPLDASIKRRRVGERRLMKCGMWATITGYRSSVHISVKFDNGDERTDVSYISFQKGQVLPKTQKQRLNSLIGNEKLMKNGIRCRITKAISAMDIDVEWEDREISRHIRHSEYKAGRVKHPLMMLGRSDDFHGYILKGVVMRQDGEVYYKAVKPDGSKDIMKMSDILKDVKSREKNSEDERNIL